MRLSQKIVAATALLVVLSLVLWRLLPSISSTDHVRASSPSPIQHVVMIEMENHTFDNYFGRFPGANGTTTLAHAPDPLPSDYNHGSEAAIAAIDGGKMDGFEAHSYYQYTQSDIPNYWSYAQQFGLGDNFFSSYLTSSVPNHMSLVTAQNGGIYETTTQTGCTSSANTEIHSRNLTGLDYWSYPCYNITSLPTLLDNAGLKWRFYSAVPIWDPPRMIKSLFKSPDDVHNLNAFTQDIKAGNLPAVSWITPTGIATDHPPSPIEPAENFVTQEVNAIMNSQYWSNTAIFITWDDWGGEYDHVVPPQIDSLGTGMRVPVLVISPYAKHGYISHQQSEFTSFVKFIEQNWNLPNLGQRDALSTISDMTDYFDFNQTPQPKFILNPVPFSSTLLVPSPGIDTKTKTAGTLNPIIGGTNTSYQFSINYTKTNTPAIHNVTIDAISYPMTVTSSIVGGGHLYQYSTTLGVGKHTYSFTFSNGTGTLTLPDNGVQYDGPEVHPFTLSAATSPISPAPALTGQNVTYNVTYTSLTNPPVAPTTTNVIIDGVAHAMQATGTLNYAKGVHYVYSASGLSQGLHYAIYSFDDGSGPAAYPGRLAPIVTPITLSNSSVSPTSGPSSTQFTFQTIYANASGTAPTQALLYVDNVSYPMSYVSGSYNTGAVYQVQTTLPTGNHKFFFVLSDNVSAWGDPVAPASYAGPNVGANAAHVTPGTIIPGPEPED